MENLQNEMRVYPTLTEDGRARGYMIYPDLIPEEKAKEEKAKDEKKDSPGVVRVYVDQESDKYYLDNFAAAFFGLTDYNSKMNSLFEISKEILERIVKLGYTIEYNYLKSSIIDENLENSDKSKSSSEYTNSINFDDYYVDNKKNTEELLKIRGMLLKNYSEIDLSSYEKEGVKNIK